MALFLWGLGLACLIYLGYRYRDRIAEWLPGWKTYVWNGFLAVSSVALPILDELKVLDWQSYLTPTSAAVAGLTVAVVGILLRAITR